MLDIVKHGLRIDFVSQPKLSSVKGLKQIGNLPLQTTTLILELLKIGAIQESQEKLIYLNRIFTVPKANGKLRLILDLKKLNVHVKTPKFTLPSINQILLMINSDTCSHVNQI